VSDKPRLSGILGEIEEAAGLAVALQLASERGGREVYIPQPGSLTAEHWLVQLVGMEAAQKVAQRIGGGRVELPLGPAGGSRSKVWATIRQALSEGKSAPEAARLAGVHHKTVRRHKNGYSGAAGDDDSQGRLF
jgi:hypothetical protein